MIKSRGFTNRGSLGKFSWALALFLILSFLPFAHAETERATSIPWSGYWWPYTKGGLGTGLDYRGRPAPLEKYNLLTTGMTAGNALDAYLDAYYDPEAPSWYGLCAYWALAACYEHVDILPSSEENVIFRVGDKKGLLTLAHNNDFLELGNGAAPEEFHFWLLHYIKDRKKAFVADLYAGAPVWSYPIYQYEMATSLSGNVESVSVKIYYADDFVAPDYIGTQIHTTQYTYELFLDAAGAITGGQWTGTSVADHPELLSFSLGTGAIFPGLDYREIVRLAGSRDDFLEKGDQTVDIGPGTYNLVLLDEDVYRISAKSGDILSLRVEKEPGSLRDIEAVVVDGNGNEVRRAVVADDSPLDDLLTLTTPPYTIRLTQDDYTDPNIYLLKADLKRSFNQQIPYIPRAGEWSGFALTNSGSAAVEGVTLTTRKTDGAPVQTVLGPLTLRAGEKRIFLFDDLPERLTEIHETDGMTLAADGPVDLLNLIGEGYRFLATFVQGDARGSRLVIPDTAAPMTQGARMFGGVGNESFEETEVLLRLYSGDGLLLNEVTETVAAGGWLSIKPGFDPFYAMPKSGWIEILGNGEQPLSGFQYTSNASGVETLFALPVSGVRKIVPHIPEPGYWTTQLTLINPNDRENRVRLHLALAGADSTEDLVIVLAPREKRVLEIQDQFGKRAGDPLYHSILDVTGFYPLVGYVTYSVPNGNDHASYPLLDESCFKGTLSLPHYPGNDGAWWTGVVVCNPSTFPVTAWIEPYDHDRKLMEGREISINLAAGAYDVFEVASRFGETASGISFLRFRTEGDSGAIGGFYLYGDSGNQILSGANMQ
ncbi:MAG: hypothetical protein JXL20_02470 [Deltaproteobacteria bacterium]|nr:hypothetical protein [Deltaproteobacteria bacterium]